MAGCGNRLTAGCGFRLLLRPALSPSRVAPITLLAGLCLREAIEKVCKVQSKLKWPNDLMVPSPQPSPDGRGRGEAAGEGSYKKLAGILTEMSGQMERTDWVVIGVGVNVNNVLPPICPRARCPCIL